MALLPETAIGAIFAFVPTMIIAMVAIVDARDAVGVAHRLIAGAFGMFLDYFMPHKVICGSGTENAARG